MKEPLEIVGYPTIVEVYAGGNTTFAVNITNHASVPYRVALEFSLNDTFYQTTYVTFSNQTYIVYQGASSLTAWMKVAEDAPPATLELTVEFSRASVGAHLIIEAVTFRNDSGALGVDLIVRNSGTADAKVVEVYEGASLVSSVTYDPPTQMVSVGSSLKISFNLSWVSGTTYHFKVVTEAGQTFTYYATAP